MNVLVIPDVQAKPDVPLDHLRWIGRYIVEKKPDLVLHLGDHWDMPSLSSYDRGKMAFEGRRYKADIEAGNKAMRLLDAPLNEYNRGRRRRGQDEYLPRRVLLRGNHENRIVRMVEDHPELEGLMGEHDLLSPGWEVISFLEPFWINDALAASHYWYAPTTGRAYGGTAINMLKTIGHSFIQGHRQTFDYAVRPVGTTMHRGLVAGACYLHREDYLGPQGNSHWRGVVMLNDVRGGNYAIMEVDLDYLCERYEGVALSDFMSDVQPPPQP